MDNYYERAKAIRTKHLKYFPQGCKILDVGCAEGTLMKYMAERGYSVFGVDNDQRQIQAAADANMPVSNEDAISFLRRHTKTYDGLVCSHVIEHIPVDHTEAFVESCYDIPLAGGAVTISKAVHPSRNRINSS